MSVKPGKMTVGDENVRITYTVDEALSGDIDFEILKPDGSLIRRDATGLDGASAYYDTATGDVDQAGEWFFFLRNVTSGFRYVEDGANSISVRPTPAEMGKR